MSGRCTSCKECPAWDTRVGAGAVWMSGGDACVAQAHPGTFPVVSRILVEPDTVFHGLVNKYLKRLKS